MKLGIVAARVTKQLLRTLNPSALSRYAYALKCVREVKASHSQWLQSELHSLQPGLSFKTSKTYEWTVLAVMCTVLMPAAEVRMPTWLCCTVNGTNHDGMSTWHHYLRSQMYCASVAFLQALQQGVEHKWKKKMDEESVYGMCVTSVVQGLFICALNFLKISTSLPHTSCAVDTMTAQRWCVHA